MTNARFSRITDELLSAYLDDEVTAEERGWVDEAVAADATIAWRLSSLQQTVHLLRSLPAVAMPRSFVLSPEEATQEMVVQTPAPVAEPARTLSAQKRGGGVWASFQRWWGSGSPLWRNAAAMSLTLLLVLISAPRFLATGPMGAAAPAAVMAPTESGQEVSAPAASVADAAAAPEVAGAVDTSSAVDAGGGAEVAAAAQPEIAEADSLADSTAPEDASAAASGATSSDVASGNAVAAGEASVGGVETACPSDGISCGVAPGGEGDAPAEMGLALMPSGSGSSDPLGEAAAAGSAGDPALRTGATDALVFPAAPPMAAAPAAGAVVENAAAESAPAESASAESASAMSEAVVAEIPLAAAEVAPAGESSGVEAAAPAAKQLVEVTATALPAEQASAAATVSPLPAATAAPEVAAEPAAETAIVAEAEAAEAVEPVALAGEETDQRSSETVATVVAAAPVGPPNWVTGGLWAAAAATLLFGALWWRSRRP